MQTIFQLAIFLLFFVDSKKCQAKLARIRRAVHTRNVILSSRFLTIREAGIFLYEDTNLFAAHRVTKFNWLLVVHAYIALVL